MVTSFNMKWTKSARQKETSHNGKNLIKEHNCPIPVNYNN